LARVEEAEEIEEAEEVEEVKQVKGVEEEGAVSSDKSEDAVAGAIDDTTAGAELDLGVGGLDIRDT
jgi:hypothetical protein